MTIETLENGLLVDTEKNQYFGYILNFDGKGSFSPNGRIGELTNEQIECHNKALSAIEHEAMLKTGKGLLYLTEVKTEMIKPNGEHIGQYYIADFIGEYRINLLMIKKSFHNFAGKNGRTDLWFCLNGFLWHGVNIGDSQICKVKQTKTKAN